MIVTVTAATSITVITAATVVRAAVAEGSLTPDDVRDCKPPLARLSAEGPPQLTGRSPLARRTVSHHWPVGRPAAAVCWRVGRHHRARASAAMQP